MVCWCAHLPDSMYRLPCPLLLASHSGFWEMMVKNKVRIPAQAKVKRLKVPVRTKSKVNPNGAADAAYATPSEAKTSAHVMKAPVVVAPSNSSAQRSQTPRSLTPSQTASCLTMPSSVTQDTSPRLSATHLGSPSPYTLELITPPGQSASTNSHHTNSTMPATEAHPTPDNDQSPRSAWGRCSSGVLSQWATVPDHLYAHAAAIFDHAREERPGGLGVIRYGPKKETPPCPPPASTAQEHHQAYQLAFSSLKCKCVCCASSSSF